MKPKLNKKGSCWCKLSPTGDCIGWHSLTKAELAAAQLKWKLEKKLY